MSGAPNPSSRVAQIILPGSEPPAEVMKSYQITWGDRIIKKFREVKIPRKTDPTLALPTLYLHFLDESFRVLAGGVDLNLRAGNDMAEVIVKLPSEYFKPDFPDKCGDIKEDVKMVVDALRRQGEVIVAKVSERKCEADADCLFYALATARPKAGISLDKKAFGIPETADQYLFVNNHSSVGYFEDDVRAAFNNCIMEMPDIGKDYPPAAKFVVFLKLFYEGGFAYNKKEYAPNGTSYLPKNVGSAAMSVVASFDGQAGIGTGFPYQLPASFLRFVDTVPISIEAISSMSDQHGRYGMCFTRSVFVWEGDAFADGTLDFCSIVPHGGFYYVPNTMKELKEKGGLVYAFGESTTDSGEELSAA